MTSLLLVLLLLGSTGLFFWHRRGRWRPEALLQVTSRVVLSPRAGLALVDAEGERLIVAWGEASPRLIARVGGDGTWEMPPEVIS